MRTMLVWGAGLSMVVAAATHAALFEGELYYTRFTNRLPEVVIEETTRQSGGLATVVSINGIAPAAYPDVVNVRKVSYSWNSVTQQLVLGSPVDIAQTLGADGILFAPDGGLLVGGQTNAMHKLPSDGSAMGNPGLIQTAALPAAAKSFHLAMDPERTRIWTSDQPDAQVSEVSLNFGSTIVSHPVTGNRVTQLGFAPALTALNPNLAYYTSSNRDGGTGGDGQFGILDRSTFTTSTKLTLLSSHSIQYDPFTGDLLLFGDSQVTQLAITDPLNPQVKSTLNLTTPLAAVAENLVVVVNVPIFGNQTRTEPLNVLDQGVVDGLGHAFAAVNSGHLVFLDYSATGLIQDAVLYLDGGTGKIPFLDDDLDDLAPLAGPGSVPEPATFTLLALLVAATIHRKVARPEGRG